QYKRSVLAGETDLDALDPYMRLYQRLESYLRSGDDEARLELVRRCLYLKINRQLSRPASVHGRTWPRQLLHQLCASWGWDAQRLVLADRRARWNRSQREAVVRQLAAALLMGYVRLKEFAERQRALTPLSDGALRVLGRRLRVLFAQGAAKIGTVNPGIAPNL